MKKSLVIVLVLLTLVLSTVSPASTFLVKPDGTGDFPTIQGAIDAALPGDIVELADGLFSGSGNRDLDYQGKAITVRSQGSDPELCIIYCDGSETENHRGFDFHSGEGPESILEGVTVTQGFMDAPDPPLNSGGGISCRQGSSPSLRNLVLSENVANRGGGLACVGSGSSPQVLECTIEFNEGIETGGGVYCYSSASTFTKCTFVRNSALSGGGTTSFVSTVTFESCTWFSNAADFAGGAWYTNSDFSGTLSSCTMYANECPNGAGVYLATATNMEFSNAIIAFGLSGDGVHCQTGQPALACCDIYGNTGGDWVGCVSDQLGVNGNISADPLFCDADLGDLTLEAKSPCAPENNPECGLIGAWAVGCGLPTPIEKMTWGRLKNRYR